MDIIFIRHGESEDNVRKAYSNDDTPLTIKGREQILNTKEKLDKLNFKKVYFSPIYRTMETINILELDGIKEDLIREIDFGIFKGKTFDEISELFPNETKQWNDDIFNYTIPNGESINDAYKRIANYLQELSENNEDILLITHDGIIRLALCWIFDSIEYFFKFKLNNGSITVISIQEEFKFVKNVNI